MGERIVYIDATSGVSGDMLLVALLDLEVPVEALHDAWDAIGIDNYEVEVFETKKSDMRALRCRVQTDEASGPRNWKEYQSILKRSKLKEPLRAQAEMLCRRLFEIEARIHGTTLNRLHLHEMGGTDLLIDVIGGLAGFHYLKPDHIFASPVNTGQGFVRFSHGVYPIPTPATATLLEGRPIFQNEVSGELTTPTGALLVNHLAEKFCALPEMTLERIGVGAGEREIAGHPNVVRLFSGASETEEDIPASDGEDVFMLETNIDDSNPQLLGHFMERALAEGALDVFFQPIFMKKNRPATRLSMLVTASTREKLAGLLFSETTAIGLRYWKVGRQKLERKWREVRIGKFRVRIKESYQSGVLMNYQPEYEDCKTAAAALKKPVKEIISRALFEYLRSAKAQSRKEITKKK